MQKNIDYLFSRGPMIVLDNISKIQNKMVKIIDDTLNIDLSKFCLMSEIVLDSDFYEKDGKYIIDIDLPGVKIKDVDIALHGNKLTVSGHREGMEKPKKESEEEKVEEVEEIIYHEQGISYGSFQKVFTIPAEIDETKIKASLKNGVLTITIPKAKESKLKKIKIEL